VSVGNERVSIVLGKPGIEAKSRVSWQTLETYFEIVPLASSIG
jgi:hypothetical protein